MSVSTYKSTPQTTNTARVSRVLLGPCTDLFRDILDHHVPEIDFPKKLTSMKTKIKPLLKKPQRDMLYPQNAICSKKYVDLDFSLLYLLIRNMCGITPHANGWGYPPLPSDRSVSANLDRIREIRNTHCGHSPAISLSDADFIQVWSDLRQIVQELEFSLFGPSAKFTNVVDFLKTETMDPDQEKQYLDAIDEQKDTQDKLLEEFGKDLSQQREILSKHKKAISKQGSDLGSLKTSVLRKERKIKGKQRRLQVIQNQQAKKLRNIETKVDQQYSDEAENIIVNTRMVIESHKSSRTYIETNAVNSGLECLRKHHIVIITGKAGDGKTTSARQIMSKLSSNYIPVIIDQPTQWNTVINSAQKMVVLLDDIVGSTNFCSCKLDDWKNKFDLILSSSQKGNIYVIIALRKHILQNVRTESPGQLLFDSEFEIDLSSEDYKLSEEEMMHMITNYESVYQHKVKNLSGTHFKEYSNIHGAESIYQLTSDEKWIILESDPYYGFPHTCNLFFVKKEFFELGPRFFTHPNHWLFGNIEEMRKSSRRITNIGYCVLVYVFLYEEININDIKSDRFMEITNTIKILDVTNPEITDAIEEYRGPYLSTTSENSIYTFSHKTVYEAVLVSFGKLSPDLVIKHSSSRDIEEIIRIESYQRRQGEIVLKIPKRFYPTLVRQMFSTNTTLSGTPASISLWRYLHNMKNSNVNDKDYACYVSTNYTIQDSCFHVFSFLLHPFTDDPEFAAVAFTSLPFLYHVHFVREIFHGIIYFDKPVLMKALLNHIDSNDTCCFENNCRESDPDNNNFDNSCTDSDSDDEDYDDSEDEIIIISPKMFLSDCEEILGVKDKIHEHSHVKMLMIESSFDLMIRLLDGSIQRGQRENVLVICRYINEKPNADKYYGRIVHHNGRKMELTPLHFCIALGWNDVVDLILHAHKPTKTSNNWTCGHLAAFYGCFSMLQKCISLDENISESTSEGYKLIHALLLGLRYNNEWYKSYCLDVEEKYTLNFQKFGDQTSIAGHYQEMLSFLLSQESFSVQHLDFTLDKYGNGIAHYLVIHDQELIFDLLSKKDTQIFHKRNITELPTPLHIAAYLGRHTLLDKLWKLGVRPSTGDASLIGTMCDGRRYSGPNLEYYNKRGNVWKEIKRNRVTDLRLSVVKHVYIQSGSNQDFDATESVLKKIGGLTNNVQMPNNSQHL